MRLKLVPAGTEWDFFRLSRLTLGASALAMIASVVLFFVVGLNFGIDFRGGTTIRTESTQAVDVGDYRDALQPLALGDVSITEVFDPNFGPDQHVTMIRIQAQEGQESVSADTIGAVQAALQAAVDPAMTFPSVESVGPKVSGELIQTAIIAVVLAIAAVLFYIWLRFEWQFSVGAVAALVHDVILTIGIFSLLQIRFDLAIIAALLTIVGYSLNDTVVVFDRVRENLRKYKKMELKEVLNLSINETLSRTVMTSVTTLLGADLALRARRRRDPRLRLRDDLGRRGRHLFLGLRGLGDPAPARGQAGLVQARRECRHPVRQYRRVIDALQAALATEGLGWLILGVALGGLVRGFTGFGTAMVYLPFAGAVLSPVAALTTLVVIDLIGPLPHIPRALRDGHPRDAMRLGVGCLLGMPLGVAVLLAVAPEVFRYGVSVIALILLVLLMLGVRYRGQLTRPLVYVTGLLGGFLGGASGLAGPPVIMLYMASPHRAAVIRANLILYLLFVDVIMLGLFAWRGFLELTPILLGLVLAVPYALAIVAGAAIFNPERPGIYRAVAYAIIAAAALRGLPVFG